MSRTRTLLTLACLCAAGCGDPAPAPVPVVQSPPPVEVGTGAPVGGTAMKVIEEQRKQADEAAKGLLRSFEARAYDPRRDGALEHAEGTIAVVTAGGAQAAYRFVFDVSNPADRPVVFETVSEPEGLPSRTMIDVRNWANQACVGVFPVVVFYWPPTPLSLLPSTDGKDFIVLAAPFKSALSVSYKFDERQVVVARGEWTDPANKASTTYVWDSYHGRYVLRSQAIFEGATAQFEHDDRHGATLLDAVHVKGPRGAYDVKFTYANVRLRPK